MIKWKYIVLLHPGVIPGLRMDIMSARSRKTCQALLMEVKVVKYFKKIEKYLSKNTEFNSALHLIGGIGIGIIITYPLIGIHPVRWGLIFIGVAVIGHIWAATH